MEVRVAGREGPSAAAVGDGAFGGASGTSDLGVTGPPLPLDEILSTSDFVSLHVPLTPETRGMVSERRLALMKPSAVLVNAARGGVVDEEGASSPWGWSCGGEEVRLLTSSVVIGRWLACPGSCSYIMTKSWFSHARSAGDSNCDWFCGPLDSASGNPRGVRVVRLIRHPFFASGGYIARAAAQRDAKS